ncbi:YD repeat-containing protein [Flavobacterium sp. 270]|uniref:hypothetical protein n=1 Tax=Flavobacterium sp. 270 TaxID=2512114 RepID=UPI0010670427|nr:hypothetical protein [Flavobacterium sp. 270]TDW52417.1 YD repeat-containing protein [Flavobacterium sp. 270]
MKKIISKCIVCFFVVSFSFYGQSKKTVFFMEQDDKFNVVLNDKIKTLKIKTDYLKNKIETDSVIYFFDRKGNTETIIYYGLGLDVFNRRLKVEEVHYTFKENKLVSKINKMDFGIDGNIYQYDKKWNQVSLKEYFSNILVKETSSIYDDKNRKIENTEYLYGGFSNYNEKTQENKSNFLYEVEKCSYNANDKCVLKTVSSFRNDKKTKITEYKYDERGNLIEEGNCVFSSNESCNWSPLFGYEYNLNNQLIKKYQKAKFFPHNTDEYFVYDNKGNKIESKAIYIYTDKLPFCGYHIIYEYDEFGNKTKDEEVIGNYRSIGHQQYKTQITRYDQEQNIISDEYISFEGLTVKVINKKYVYDKKGNWIKKETEQGKDKNSLKLTEICTREIQYYH